MGKMPEAQNFLIPPRISQQNFIVQNSPLNSVSLDGNKMYFGSMFFYLFYLSIHLFIYYYYFSFLFILFLLLKKKYINLERVKRLLSVLSSSFLSVMTPVKRPVNV